MAGLTVVSLNVGQTRIVTFEGRAMKTGIFKKPVDGRRMLRLDNVEGDQQADLRVHGGTDKAVYGYPAEHYEYWKTLLVDMPSESGAFGENLTTAGLTENSLHISDHFQVGNAVLRVTQPRIPCLKLAARFRRSDMIDLFHRSGRSGFYFAVVEEGGLGAGDAIELKHRDTKAVTVADVNRLYLDKGDPELLDRVLDVPTLAGSMRRHFEKRRPGKSRR